MELPEPGDELLVDTDRLQAVGPTTALLKSYGKTVRLKVVEVVGNGIAARVEDGDPQGERLLWDEIAPGVMPPGN